MISRALIPIAVAALVLGGIGIWLHCGGGEDASETVPALPNREASEPHLAGRAGGPVRIEGERLEGLVVDGADQPQAGVRVVLAPEGAESRAIAATTDESGGFVLAVPPATEEATLSAHPGASRVGTVRRIGWGRGFPQRYRLRVWPGRRQAVRVVDAQGKGLQAEIEADRAKHPSTGAAAWRLDPTPTDADGRLVLFLPPGTVDVSTHVPGVGGITGQTIAPDAPDEVVLRLGTPNGARLEGSVHTTDGRSIAGAQVRVDVEAADGGLDHQLEATTNAKGRWRVIGLPAGELERIRAEANGFVARTIEIGSPVANESQREHDVILSRECVVTGHVVDGEGRAVADAVVECSVGWRGREAVADASGRFLFAALEAGPHTVRATRPGWTLPYARPDAGERAGAVEVVFASEGESADVTVALPKGRSVIGRVVREDGAPVDGAHVELRPPRGYGDVGEVPLPPPTETGADGTFAFSGLPGYQRIHVEAQCGTLVARRFEIDLLRHPQDEVVEIVLRPEATVAGQVVQADGSPLPRALLDDADLLVWTAWPSAWTSVDDDGRFVFGGLTAGRRYLRVRGASSNVTSKPTRVEPAWGETLEEVEIRLAPMGAVAGVVVDPRGNPIPGLELGFGENRTVARCTSAADGSFRVEGLPEGEHSVTFLDDGSTSLRKVRMGETAARLVHLVSPLRLLAGRVLDPEGQPVPSAQVHVNSDRESPRSRWLGSTTARDGAFRIEFRTLDERVVITVSHAKDAAGRSLGTATTSLGMEVDRAGLEIRLEKGLPIAGRVVDDTGRPVADVRVRIGYGAGSEVVTDAEGRFRRDGIGGDRASVEVPPTPPWAASERLWVEAGSEDLVIRLRRTWVLRGRVLSPEGTPVSGGSVHARGNGIGALAKSGTDGTFTLEGLQGDVITLSVRLSRSAREAGWMAPPDPRVTPEDDDLVLRLRQGVFVEGVVLDPDDRPATRARVRLRGPLPGRGHAYDEDLGSRDEGRFRIGPVEPGLWELSVQGRTPELGDTEPVRISAPASNVRVVLPRVPVLRGRIVGDRLEDFEVRLLKTSGDDETPWRRSQPLSKGGRFVIGDVAPEARHVLFVRNPADERFARVEGLTVADGDVSLPLVRGLALSGRVDLSDLDVALVPPTGDLWTQWEVPEVEAEGPPGVAARAAVDLDGSFAFGGLPPGSYRLTFEWTTEGRRDGELQLEGSLDGVEAGRTDVVVAVSITPFR